MRKAFVLVAAVAAGMLPPLAADRTAFEILAALAGDLPAATDAVSPVLIVALDKDSDRHPELATLPRSRWPGKLAAPLTAFADAGVEAAGFDLVWPLAGPDAPAWLAVLRRLSRHGRVVLGYLHDGERVIAPHPAQLAAAGGRAHLRSLNLPADGGRIRRTPVQAGLAHELALRAGRRARMTDSGVLLRPWQVHTVHVVSLADLLDCGIPDAGYRVVLVGAWLPHDDRHASVLRLQPQPRRSVKRLRCGHAPVPEPVQDPVPGVLLHAMGVQAYSSAQPLRRLPAPLEAVLLAACAGTLLFWGVRAAGMLSPVLLAGLAVIALPHGWLLPWAGGLAAAGSVLAFTGMQTAVRAFRAWRETLPAPFRRHPGHRVTIEASVCFIDIEQWTRRGERADAAVLAQELAACLELFNRIITAHGGYVDKYLGDGLMALFGLAGTPDHARRAVDAARACIAACNGVHGPRIAGAPVRLRAGIATGPVQAGDLGTGGRVHFTAIGDTVNVAARLEQANRSLDTRLLATEAVARACPGLGWQRLGQLELRGRNRTVTAWTL